MTVPLSLRLSLPRRGAAKEAEHDPPEPVACRRGSLRRGGLERTVWTVSTLRCGLTWWTLGDPNSINIRVRVRICVCSRGRGRGRVRVRVRICVCVRVRVRFGGRGE